MGNPRQACADSYLMDPTGICPNPSVHPFCSPFLALPLLPFRPPCACLIVLIPEAPSHSLLPCAGSNLMEPTGKCPAHNVHPFCSQSLALPPVALAPSQPECSTSIGAIAPEVSSCLPDCANAAVVSALGQPDSFTSVGGIAPEASSRLADFANAAVALAPGQPESSTSVGAIAPDASLRLPVCANAAVTPAPGQPESSTSVGADADETHINPPFVAEPGHHIYNAFVTVLKRTFGFGFLVISPTRKRPKRDPDL